MPPLDPHTLSGLIHRSGTRLVLVITGGGSQAIGRLLSVPGGSHSLLEAAVPYSSAALHAWLGSAPEHYCTQRTARDMAMAAYLRACRYDPAAAAAGSLAGVGCTASLVSDRPKRGPHRAHVAAQTARTTESWSLELTKGARDRSQEEPLVADLTLNAIAAACGLAQRLALPLLPGECVAHWRTEAPAEWQELLSGRRKCHCQSGSPQPPAALFPGAFCPRHAGHRRMAAVAAEMLDTAVAHELSIENVDKPLMDFREIELRVAEFAPDETLWLTRAATFVEKGRLFPGAVFIVGLDTIVRIAEPHYYGGDAAACARAIDELAALGCRFLVFGRRVGDRFQTLGDLPLPAALAALCQGVAADRFCEDISSTELRRQRDEA